MAEYEAKITVYRNGRRIAFSDALADSPSDAVYAAQNDLYNDMTAYEMARPQESPRGPH